MFGVGTPILAVACTKGVVRLAVPLVGEVLSWYLLVPRPTLKLKHIKREMGLMRFSFRFNRIFKHDLWDVKVIITKFPVT